MKNLQSESSSPLYHQLMQRLSEDIERGKYPVGSRIPPEHELEALYKVSRVTVRRALSELTAEGLLEKKQGKGTFVSTPRISQDLKSIHSFHDACKMNGFRGGTVLVHVKEVEADDSDIRELELREVDTKWLAEDLKGLLQPVLDQGGLSLLCDIGDAVK